MERITLKRRAQELRNNMTQAERVLWNAIRKDRLGLRFGRQRRLRGFIVDFYWPKGRLIIEIDGPLHRFKRQRDTWREDILRKVGYEIIRFTNYEVMNELPRVLSRISTVAYIIKRRKEAL